VPVPGGFIVFFVVMKVQIELKIASGEILRLFFKDNVDAGEGKSLK
jgi:hypothetical protein